MSQTSYSVDQPVAFVGMLADLSRKNDVISRVNAQGADIPSGIVVKQGSTDEEAVYVTDAAGPVLGIALHSHASEIDGMSGEAVIPDSAAFNVLSSGRVYVKVEDAVSAEDDVYVRTASGSGGEQLGALRSDDDTASARKLNGARFKTSASAGGLAVVELDGQLSLA